MKINFIFSEIYHNNLNRHSVAKENWSIVKKHAEDFIKIYTNKIEEIIREIPKITETNWPNKKEIDVYVVGWKGPSFSNPLTLRIRKDHSLTLATLTHELLHIMFKEEGPSLELEIKINNYVDSLFKRLDIIADEQISLMRKFSQEKYSK